jgi:beta-mannosidase
MSEFGFQSLPPLETVRTYADEEDWNMTSYIMELHQRSGSGNGLMIGQMTDTFRMPRDFRSLTYLSMLLQAEGIRYGVEHWRRNKHRVGGTLYWQLNDCWPVASWASLDYFGRWKALHYAAKRFFAPVLVSIEDIGTKMNLHVTSDSNQIWRGQVRWQLMTLDGEPVQSGEIGVELSPLASQKILELDFGQIVNNSYDRRRELILVVELLDSAGRLSSVVTPFVPNKHLALKDPRLEVQTAKKGQEITFLVKAFSLARFVELKLDGADVVFSDNYFDVPAGWSRAVTCPIPPGWTLQKVRKALQVTSLYHSY